MRYVIASVLLLGSLTATDKPKSVIHVSHLNLMTVGISCLNGADPTGEKVGDVVIMSCGK